MTEIETLQKELDTAVRNNNIHEFTIGKLIDEANRLTVTNKNLMEENARLVAGTLSADQANYWRLTMVSSLLANSKFISPNAAADAKAAFIYADAVLAESGLGIPTGV